jgi:hypothetical protein
MCAMFSSASMTDKSFAIARMDLVDVFNGDDDASMAANNTSGYNCRRASGSARLSSHALGLAIDVNPLINPYVSRRGTAPKGGEAGTRRKNALPPIPNPASFSPAAPSPGPSRPRAGAGAATGALPRITSTFPPTAAELQGTRARPDLPHVPIVICIPLPCCKNAGTTRRIEAC